MQMSFFLLALLCLVALVGPLLNLPRRMSVPVVVGELVVGIVFGTTGLDLFDPQDPTFNFMAQVGFALVMFLAGTQVPFHDSHLRTGLTLGLRRALTVAALAIPVGYALAEVFDTDHGLIYAVIMASSSASLVVPSLGSVKIAGKQATAMIMQIAVADAAAIVVLPVVMAPDRVHNAVLGSLAVICLAAGYAILARSRYVANIRAASKKRRLVLEMRIVLASLFALAGVATAMGVSVMLAGFALGLAVSVNGEPKRLRRQMFALTEGFFAPLFFVWLGASINLRALAEQPLAIVLGLSLAAIGVLLHLVPALVHQPLLMAAATAGQLGIPVGAVALGQHGLLRPWEAPAFLLGAVISIAVVAVVAPRIAAQLDAESRSAQRHPNARIERPPAGN